uniref:Uncharacterized protein n=1 Tax=Siphoviridae sp. ctxMM9 TaxID=2827973 RepID=A0A8S5T6V7_9CAUD|nr:MAG TPA: hypothetical protein [Siphoviridae sp. ctxMM9]
MFPSGINLKKVMLLLHRKIGIATLQPFMNR